MKKKKITSDLTLNTYSQYDTGKSENKNIQFLRLFFVAILSLSTILMFNSFIDMDAISPITLGIWSIGFTGLFSIFKTKNTSLKALGIVLILVLVAYFAYNYKLVYNGFIYIINEYLRVTINDSGILIGLEKYEKSVNTAYILLLMLINLGLCSSLFYSASFKGTFFLTFPFFELGAYWGLVPNYLTFFLMITSWAISLGMSNSTQSRVKTNKVSPFRLRSKDNTYEVSSVKVKNQNANFTFSYALKLCGLCIVLTFVLSVFFGNRPESIDVTRKNLKASFKDFSIEEIPEKFEEFTDNITTSSNKKIGTTNSGKLGRSDKISFKDKTVLEVEIKSDNIASVESPLYLKGYVASYYNDNSWEEFDNDNYNGDEFFKTNHISTPYYQDYNSIQYKDLMSSEILEETCFGITIKNKNANTKYLYTPYYADYDTIKFKEAYKDFYLIPKDDEYSYKFYGGTLYDWSSNERMLKKYYDLTEFYHSEYGEYTSFAKKNYTEYDFDVISSAYYTILEQYGYDNIDQYVNDLYSYYGYGEIDELTKAEFVAGIIKQYFAENFTYSLDVGKTPSGEDFVKYFLEEQKSGSCTYFASAGVLLMRAMGFPARYVEGFMVSKDEFKSSGSNAIFAEVKDSDAHAWCEIFIESIGWIPVEFTIGYENGQNPNINTSTTPSTTTSQPTTTTTTTIISSANGQISSSTQTSQSILDTTTTVSSSIDKQSKNTSKADYNKIFEIAIRIVLKIVLILGVLLVWKFLYTNKRKKFFAKINNPNRRVGVKAIYNEMCDIFKILGFKLAQNKTDLQNVESIYKMLCEKEIAIDEDMLRLFVEIAVEADMSQNEISQESFEFEKDIFEMLGISIWEKLSPFKKFYAKFIRFLY